MKRILLSLVLSIPFICSCDSLNIFGDANPGVSNVFDLEDLFGRWDVTKVKFSQNADMADWSFVETSITFNEAGSYEGVGYWGDGRGTYGIDGNVITTYVNLVPYIKYEVLSLDNNIALIKVSIMLSGQELWIECEKYINNIIIEQNGPFLDQETANMVLAKAYMTTRDFVFHQHCIEYNAIVGSRNEISPSSELIYTTMVRGNRAIRELNLIISSAQHAKITKPWASAYEASARVIRAFVFYNMVSLWGDVGYMDENFEYYPDSKYFRTDATELLNAEIESVKSCISGLESLLDNGHYEFLPDAANLLLAEMYMYLNDTSLAKTYLDKIATKDYAAEPIFSFDLDDLKAGKYSEYISLILKSGGSDLQIYRQSTVGLYKKEIAGALEDVVAEWSGEPQYGYWMALRRAGKAQDVTGCESYQLLMPIYSEIVNGSMIDQNPGY